MTRPIQFQRPATTSTVESVYLGNGPGPLLVHDTKVAGAVRGLVMTDNGHHEHTGSRIERCHLRGLKEWHQGERVNRVDWGLRVYDFAGEIRETEIHAIGSEHAIYVNPAGSILVEDCYLHDLGGQAFQAYWRSWESHDPGTYLQPKTLELRRVLARQYGRNLPYADRQGFGFTFGDVGPNVRVIVRDCYQRVNLRAFKAHGGWWNSYGGIVVQRAGQVELVGGFLHHRRPDRPVIQVERAARVLLEGYTVPEGLIDLWSVDDLVVRDCHGGARVRWKGKDLGQLEELRREG